MFLTMAEKKSYHIFNLYLKIVRPKHIAGVTTNDNKNTTETSSCKQDLKNPIQKNPEIFIHLDVYLDPIH